MFSFYVFLRDFVIVFSIYAAFKILNKLNYKAVPCRLLHTGHRCWQAVSQVGHTANDGGATTSAIHCWLPSIRRARPHDLELLDRRPPRTAGL